MFSTCSCAQVETYPNVTAPANNKVPIEGKWKFYDYIKSDNMPDSIDSEILIGEEAQFNKNEVLIAESYWKNPSYKIKCVDADEYFAAYKYNTTKEKLGIQGKNIYVVSVTSADKFLYEFVEVNKSEIMVTIKGITYLLKKVSDKTDNNLSSVAAKMQLSVTDGEKETSSCVLLGIRSQKTNSDGTINYSYKTLWIGYNKNNLEPILQSENIFLPRRSGFWNVEVKKVSDGAKSEDFIEASSISNSGNATSNELTQNNESSKKSTKSSESVKNNLLTLNGAEWKNRNGSIQKAITYIGNDYVSLEVNSSGKYISTGSTWEENTLEMEPVDNTNLPHGIDIQEISEDNGFSILMNDRSNAVNNIMGTINSSHADSDFALKREFGYWCFYGRVNYIEDNISKYVDYKINITPPKKVVFYDDLAIPWKVIQDKLPEAKDAFTSPNADIAVIITPQNYLNIYKIENGTLSASPLKKIKLQDQDSICMAEWATGSFVNTWQKEFIKHGSSAVSDGLQ